MDQPTSLQPDNQVSTETVPQAISSPADPLGEGDGPRKTQEEPSSELTDEISELLDHNAPVNRLNSTILDAYDHKERSPRSIDIDVLTIDSNTPFLPLHSPPTPHEPPPPSDQSLVPPLTSQQRSILLRRTRKLERYFGASLDTSVLGSLSIRSPPPPAIHRSLSEPPSPASPEITIDACRLPAHKRGGTDTSVLERRWTAGSSPESSSWPPAHHQASPLFDPSLGQTSESEPTDTSYASSTTSETRRRRARLAKIHHMLGGEVPVEQVFASEPGGGPWLVNASGPISAGSKTGAWKERLSALTGGRAGPSPGPSEDKKSQRGGMAKRGEPGNAWELEGQLSALSEEERLEGVKRGAKLNTIFGDFPPPNLYLSAKPSMYTHVASSTDSVDTLPTVKTYQRSIDMLDQLLTRDPDTLSILLTSLQQEPADRLVESGDEGDELLDTNASDSHRSRVRVATKLSRFFGEPAYALGLFSDTLDTLEAGVQDERREGRMGEGEERTLLGSLGKLKAAVRELTAENGLLRGGPWVA